MLVLVLAGAGVFLAALDQTSVITALPEIVDDLELPITRVDQAAWIVTGYLLGYTAAMPLLGRISDVYGHSRIFLFSMLVFLAGSVGVALADDLWWLVAARVVQAIGVDEETHTMDIAVNEDNLPQAIGRAGQNVRLASDLTGWTLNIMSEEEAAAKQEQEASQFVEQFMETLDVDEEVALILADGGFTSLEEIAYVPLEEMLAIAEFDEEIVGELRTRAKDALLTQAIASEEQLSDAQPADDLLELDGMDKRLAYVLASNKIVTREDLAEQAVDELLEIEDVGEARAGQLIMAARAHWFEDENDEEEKGE